MSTSRSALYPGYKHVETFAEDVEYEERDGEVEEEVVYVTLDLGAVEPTLVPSSSSFRLIGLDTPTPFLQLSGTVFKGQHQTLFGTELLFTEAKDGANDHTKKPFAPLATTEHQIRFREVEVRPKSDSVDSDAAAPAQSSSSSKKRAPKTLDEVVGNDIAQLDEGAPVRRGKRRTKNKGKGKEKAVKRRGKKDASSRAEEPDVGRNVGEQPSQAGSIVEASANGDGEHRSGDAQVPIVENSGG